MNWINCDDRLPDPDVAVLCFYMDGGQDHCVAQNEHNGDRWLFSMEHTYGYHITHWMPLPEPPK